MFSNIKVFSTKIKISKIFIFLFCFFGIHFSANAFIFKDENPGNIYLDVEKSLGNVDNVMYNAALTQSNRTFPGEILNNSLIAKGYNPCFVDELSAEQFNSIATGNVGILSEILKEECKGNGSLSIDQISHYLGFTSELSKYLSNNASLQSEVVHRLSAANIYADGIAENGPFDLYTDLENIDKILFKKELKYEGGAGSIFEDMVMDFLMGNNSDEDSDYIASNSPNNSENGNEEEIPELPEEDPFCFVDNTGLGINIANLGITKNISEIPDPENLSENNEKEEFSFSNSGFTKHNDNASWPCGTSGFGFCVKIDIKTSSKNLLTGGKDLNSLQSILENSNGHLYKTINSPMLEKKHTTNNLESTFLKLDLAAKLSTSVNIVYKPVPILNLENKSDEEKERAEQRKAFSSDKLLDSYFSALGRDSSRQNSLDDFLGTDYENLATLNTAGLTILEAAENYKYVVENPREYNLISKAVANYASSNFASEFERKLYEVEIFTNAMSEYTNNLHDLIVQLEAIPQYSQ